MLLTGQANPTSRTALLSKRTQSVALVNVSIPSGSYSLAQLNQDSNVQHLELITRKGAIRIIVRHRLERRVPSVKEITDSATGAAKVAV
jgi:hypothetical protein